MALHPRLVIVGAGPRAIMLLERILANLGPAGALEITLVDPFSPGGGRIWRYDQSPLLKLNTLAQDNTVFTDETSTIAGPILPGPSLIEWAGQVRAGERPEVVINDAEIRAELESLHPQSFPTRRLQSYYLDWFWHATVAGAPASVVIGHREGLVVGVDEHGAAFVVHLADGSTLDADVVVYAIGHNGREPDAPTQGLIDASRKAGLTYVPPSFTADADLSALRPGQDVIVRGMGLAAVDLVVLLGEGRGGRFERTDGRLRYHPSGLEPQLHMGSARGVPSCSKVTSALQGEPPHPEVLTREAIAALLKREGQIDFDVDVRPLIRQELVWGHYRELFTGHPDRMTTTWEAFSAFLREKAGDSSAVRAEAARVIPDPLDRFDVDSLDRPLEGEKFATDAELQQRIRRHIADDLTRRTSQDHSSAQALFLTTLLTYLALADIPPHRWSARSRAVALPIAWHRFFSFIASGPPGHRLEEFLALSLAGILHFLGPEVSVRIDPDRGFVATSPSFGQETVAQALVDAWLPGSGASVSDNPALRELAARHGRELSVSDADFHGWIGLIEVDSDGHVLAGDGRARDGLFAIGPFTSLAGVGAFTRPNADSLPLRQTDQVARAVVARLRVASVISSA